MPIRYALALAFAALAAPAHAQDFADDFDAPQLDARWEWHSPAQGPSYSLTDSPGSLRVTVPSRPGGFSHWDEPAEKQTAPLLLTPVPESDFTLEGRLRVVEYGKESNFHIGLIAAPSKRNVACWGPFFGPLIYPMEAPEVWAECTGFPRLARDAGPVSDLWLRLECSGGYFRFAVKRSAAEQWREAGRTVAFFRPRYVGLLFKTFGSGPAVVTDVDSLTLTTRPADPAPIPAHIEVDADQPAAALDPNLLGYFIEHLGRCIYHDGIWAELVRNRKFVGDAGADGALASWRRLGSDDGVELARDNMTYYTGSQSQRITSRQAKGEHGIAQDGFRLRAIDYDCRIVLRQLGDDTPVTVSLRRGDQVLAQSRIDRPTDEWRTYTFTLRPESPGPASLSITTEAADGNLWIGAVSLTPGDAVDGMRADLIEAIRALRPPIIRWPGGNFASGYHWRDGVGDRDLRPARFDRAWNVWDTNDFGTREYLRFCELVGCAPYICLNLGEGTPDEAVEWVEFCNGATDTAGGKLRADGGPPEPYGVRYWGLGNELYGDWQLGHLTPTNYGRKAVEFARAVRGVDPDVKLIGVGVEGGGWADWNAIVTRIAAPELDYLSVHVYQDAPPETDPALNYANVVTSPARYEHTFATTADIVRRESPDKAIPLAIDEWNVTARDQWNGENRPEVKLREGLYCARMFHMFHRLGDRITMANIALLVNAMGVLQSDATRVALTPAYQAFQLYREHTGTHLARAAVEPSDAPLDVLATTSPDAGRTYIAVVNYHPFQDARAALASSGDTGARPVRALRLWGADPTSANALGAEPGVTVTELDAAALGEPELLFPAHSVTIVEYGG